MHNKEYALKLVRDKLNGLNNYSYLQIANLTGYKKLQIIRFSKLINEKDIDSILVHGLTGKPSNNSPSTKEAEFIKNFKNQYPVISISQFMDIYHEDILFNSKMKKVIEENHLRVRNYSFYVSLYKQQGWISPIKHKEFAKNYIAHPLREPSPRRGFLVMIDGNPFDQKELCEKLGLISLLKSFSGVLMGFSAGAMLMSKYMIITPCSEEYPSFQIGKGLNFDEISIYPHNNTSEETYPDTLVVGKETYQKEDLLKVANEYGNFYLLQDNGTDISIIKSSNGSIEFYIENDGKIWEVSDDINLVSKNLSKKI